MFRSLNASLIRAVTLSADDKNNKHSTYTPLEKKIHCAFDLFEAEVKTLDAKQSNEDIIQYTIQIKAHFDQLEKLKVEEFDKIPLTAFRNALASRPSSLKKAADLAEKFFNLVQPCIKRRKRSLEIQHFEEKILFQVKDNIYLTCQKTLGSLEFTMDYLKKDCFQDYFTLELKTQEEIEKMRLLISEHPNENTGKETKQANTLPFLQKPLHKINYFSWHQLRKSILIDGFHKPITFFNSLDKNISDIHQELKTLSEKPFPSIMEVIFNLCEIKSKFNSLLNHCKMTAVFQKIIALKQFCLATLDSKFKNKENTYNLQVKHFNHADYLYYHESIHLNLNQLGVLKYSNTREQLQEIESSLKDIKSILDMIKPTQAKPDWFKTLITLLEDCYFLLEKYPGDLMFFKKISDQIYLINYNRNFLNKILKKTTWTFNFVCRQTSVSSGYIIPYENNPINIMEWKDCDYEKHMRELVDLVKILVESEKFAVHFLSSSGEEWTEQVNIIFSDVNSPALTSR